MPLPATLAEYFQRSDARRVLLLEITRNTSGPEHYYLSDDTYATDGDDSLPHVIFTPAIQAGGVPGMKRFLADPFDGVGSTSFGNIILATDLATFLVFDQVLAATEDTYLAADLAGAALLVAEGDAGQKVMTLKRGAQVTARLAAPRALYGYDDALTLLVGRVARISGSSDGEISLEIRDRSDSVRNASVTVSDSPLCMGLCRNVEPLVDADGVYRVHDGEIQAIRAVYSDGVLVNADEYSVDLEAGRFTLLVNPAGTKITADVEGAIVDGVWLSTTEDACRELIRRSGMELTQTYEAVNEGIIGLYVTEPVRLGETLSSLLRGAAAYWLLTALGEFYAGTFPLLTSTVDSDVELAGERVLLERLTYEEDDRLFRSMRFLYRRNWTKYQPRDGASAEMAAFTQREGLEDEVVATDPDSELTYSDGPRLETYFDNRSNAFNATTRILRRFSVPRKIVRSTLPYSLVRRLGDRIVLSVKGRNYPGVITGLSDVFDGGYPAQKLEVLS